MDIGIGGHLERLTWDVRIGAVQEHVARYVWALKWCVGKHVLDLPCGIGYGTMLIAEVAGAVVGVDQSAEAIAVAELRPKFHPNTVFVRASIEEYRHNCFDTVVCLEGLEHFEDMEAGLAKLLELTAPGGTLLLSLPVASGPSADPNPYHHGREWTIAQCDAFLDNRGLDMVCFFQPLVGDEDTASNVQILPRDRATETEAPQWTPACALYRVRKTAETEKEM